MKKYTSSQARREFYKILDDVSSKDQLVSIGRYNKMEVLVMKYPAYNNPELSDVSHVNANSSSFAFLENEPDLYSVDDLKKSYV